MTTTQMTQAIEYVTDFDRILATMISDIEALKNIFKPVDPVEENGEM